MTKICQNPREASSRSRIFLISLIYVCIYVLHLCISVTPPANEKRYRPEIWYTYSYRPYLKTGFLIVFFEKMTPRATSLEKLPCHVGIFRISPRLPRFRIYSLLSRIKSNVFFENFRVIEVFRPLDEIEI